MGQADEGSSLEWQARDRFGELESAETALLRALPLGEEINYAIREEGRRAGRRQLRAELIRWICVNATVQGRHTDSRGIRISDAEITGKLDLSSSLSLPFPLSLSFCDFDQTIEITGAELKGLSLKESHTRGLSADGVQITGDLTLNNGFVATGPVHLRGANISGSLKCDGGKFDKDTGARALDFLGPR
jgi:Rad3-related DNA helicase